MRSWLVGCLALAACAAVPSTTHPVNAPAAAAAPATASATPATAAAAPATTTAPATAAALPAVELRTLDGARARLDDVVRGKVAIVSLWATWCEACGRELDALARLDGAARKAGATLLTIAVGEERQHVAEFTRRRGLGWMQLVDEEFRLADALGQRRVPATLVIDRGGRIVFAGGALDDAALAALRRALAEGAPASLATAR